MPMWHETESAIVAVLVVLWLGAPIRQIPCKVRQPFALHDMRCYRLTIWHTPCFPFDASQGPHSVQSEGGENPKISSVHV